MSAPLGSGRSPLPRITSQRTNFAEPSWSILVIVLDPGLVLDVGRDDLAALRHEQIDCRPADAAGGPGDHRFHLAVELSSAMHFPLVLS